MWVSPWRSSSAVTFEDAMAAAEAVTVVSYDELPPVATVADTRTARTRRRSGARPGPTTWRSCGEAATSPTVEKALGADAPSPASRFDLPRDRQPIEPRISLALATRPALVLHRAIRGRTRCMAS